MSNATTPQFATPSPSGRQTLRHVVLFRFHDATTDEQVAAIVERFSALSSQIPEIEHFEWGVNHSHEGLDHGLTHCFNLTFASRQARDRYLVHRAHVTFGAWIGTWVADVTVVDFQVAEPRL
jgi:hypothetical protein